MPLRGVPLLRRVGRVVETHIVRTIERMVGLDDKGTRLGGGRCPTG